MKYCSSPTLLIYYYECHWYFFTPQLSVAVLQFMMRLKNRLFYCEFPWLIALWRLAVGIMIPTVNSSTWFDSLLEMLLILTIPRCSWRLSEQQGRVWPSADWWLAAAAFDMQLVSSGSWSACITAVWSVSSLRVVWLKPENTFSDGKHRSHFVGCKEKPPWEKQMLQKINPECFTTVPCNSQSWGFKSHSPISHYPRSGLTVCLPSHAGNTISVRSRRAL